MNNTYTSFENMQDYIRKLGHFWQSFNNLELFLRLYIHRKIGGDRKDFQEYCNAKEGSELPVNPITDYQSFSELCKAFNMLHDEKNKIDFTELVRLRDALAHGRVSGDMFANMNVIKFSSPQKGKVKVVYNKQLTPMAFEKIINEIAAICMEISIRMGAKKPVDFNLSKVK